MWDRSLGLGDTLENSTQPTPEFLPRKLHGQRSLVGYSPWGLKELDILSPHTWTGLHTGSKDSKLYMMLSFLFLKSSSREV